MSTLDSSTQFCDFIERVVTAGYYLNEIDYPAFLELISRYAPEILATRASVSLQKIGVVRFAGSIQLFPPERSALYRNPFLADESAEYLFEPVMMEKTISVPIYEKLEDGTENAIGLEEKVVQVKTTLNFDEFVAAMWLKGIRFGIDEAAVRSAIADGRFARIAVAHALPATPGTNADLQEIGSKLHRDDAPLKLPNGAIDLRHFGNRFPQVKAGERLMQKIPCTPGQPGISLMARPTLPPPPEDFDLAPLAGDGTAIVKTTKDEFLVANIDGFLNVDAASNRISVTEKIINYSGVSLRTTGDIALKGEHFEEHGEVQEKRVVKGKNITVMADVFGEVESQGGTIQLKQNLVGGAASNIDGDIHIAGLTSNATVIAKKGRIVLSRAENAVIVGQAVEIDIAANCCILAESISINSALSCMIGATQIRIGHVGSRRNTPTMLSIVLPDLASASARIAEMRLRSTEITSDIAALRTQYDALIADADVRNYLIVAGKIQRKELTLNDAQKDNLVKVKQRITPTLASATNINQQIQVLIAEQNQLVHRASVLRQQSTQAMNTVSCQIDQSAGEVHLRKLRASVGILFELSTRDLRQLLGDPGLPDDRLSVSGEPFIWRPA
ncbi:flagellar assembly protein A [Paludibacterium purpuratum]|uniref:flagellar assembly protein A n=1 Tax=Paludibacterium purpuratum TaxID=1144873 RepID=UPI0014151DEB|nr:flagellar assembly protein A [Paludibacterium purpuratum]